MNRWKLPSFRRVCFVFVVAALPIQLSAQQVVRVANTASTSPQTQHPIDPALKMARASLRHAQENIDDYTALFVKRCRVDGELPPLCYAKLKVRDRKIENGVVATPMGVYLDFLKPAAVQGREVIWKEGANDGNMVVHQGGMSRFVTLNLDPNGYIAMRGQRYPVTDIGIENLLKKIIQTAERDRQYDECEMKIYRNAKVGKVSCTMVEVIHPVPRNHFDFHRAQVFFCDDLKVPIRYKSWSWPEAAGQEPPVQEEYNYLRLAVNVGLTDTDFDPENPKYRYY